MRNVALGVLFAAASLAAGCSHSSSGVAAPNSEAQAGAPAAIDYQASFDQAAK
jgi:hypothetical protein